MLWGAVPSRVSVTKNFALARHKQQALGAIVDHTKSKRDPPELLVFSDAIESHRSDGGADFGAPDDGDGSSSRIQRGGIGTLTESTDRNLGRDRERFARRNLMPSRDESAFGIANRLVVL